MEVEIKIPLGYREITRDEQAGTILTPFFAQFMSLRTWLGMIADGFFECEFSGNGKVRGSNAFYEAYTGKIGLTFFRPDGQGMITFVEFDKEYGGLVLRLSD